MSKNKRKKIRGIGDRLKDLQQEALVAVATGVPLQDVMSVLCRRVQEICEGVICSVIRIDSTGRLRPLAAPSLPQTYSDAIEGASIGPMVGSCGSAAYFGEEVEVTNIRLDPRWRDVKDAVLALGLKACWSSPIKSHDGRVVATFAFYFRSPRRPNSLERRVVACCAHICSIAIGHWDANDRIRRLAYTDALTGLGNRALLAEMFPKVIQHAGQRGEQVAVFYVDINGFRMLNEAQGHEKGDLLLASVAKRLQQVCSGANAIVRLGSDEFLLVQAGGNGAHEFERVARELSDVLAQPHAFDAEIEIKAPASIGIACFPENGCDLQSLMGHADTALRRVKAAGRAGYAFYTARMDAENLARRALERDVSTAVTTGQLSVVYQPQADAATGVIRGFEALLRWQHPIHGFVSPATFIPAAEASGAIEEIGAFVLREALAQAAQWPSSLRVAVNASPAQIVHPKFAELVIEALEASGVTPNRLEIEVTESLFIYDSEAALTTLEKLKAAGVSVAIDDFGTGYSSLSTLRSFPFDRIKIDRSFITDMTSNADAAAIVSCIMGLGRALGRPIVAEGVETPDQLDQLREQGCSEVQGYLIGKPKSIGEYRSLTTARSARRRRPAVEPRTQRRAAV